MYACIYDIQNDNVSNFFLSITEAISLSFKKTEISSLTYYAMYLFKIHVKLFFLIKSYEILFTFKNYVCMYLAIV